MIAIASVFAVLAACGYAMQHLRWLRVLQREEYRPSSVFEYYWKWSTPPVNLASAPRPRHGERPWSLGVGVLTIIIVIDVATADALGLFALVIYCFAFPIGMPVRGREQPLAWDRRAVNTTSLALLISTAGLVPLAFTSRPWLIVTTVVALEPVALTLAAALLQPWARRTEHRTAAVASGVLARTRSRVIVVIGSHGKDSVASLIETLAGSEHVVLVATGERRGADVAHAIAHALPEAPCTVIAPVRITRPRDVTDLARWCTPDIVVVTGLSERDIPHRSTLDDVAGHVGAVAATARTVICCGDDERVSALAHSLGDGPARVRVAGTGATHDVRVARDDLQWVVDVDQTRWASAPVVTGIYQSNLACAISAALEAGFGSAARAHLAEVAPLPRHVEARRDTRGALVIDDSAAASPLGAHAVIEAFAELDVAKERWLITAGLFHAGPTQDHINAAIASDAVARRLHVAIVGRTNLISWRDSIGGHVRRFDTMRYARQWAEEDLGVGDAVLYLSEAPDYVP